MPLAPPWCPTNQVLSAGSGCHSASSPWTQREWRTHPGLDGEFSTICEAAPGSDDKPSRGVERLWEQSPIAPPPWHRARPCHPHIPARPRGWRGSRVPSPARRALSPGSLFVCQHITCRRWMTREGRIFFNLSVVVLGWFFFLTKPKYFCPHGDGSGSLSMDSHTGVPAGRGHPAP